ncbi:phage tail protein [Lysinibacillus sphaericus]|uniref:Tail fiber protein n=3 Tax=Lysinibacillus TaxID=400634 RepID=W7S9K3_LYSSH|nr:MULTISPECIES: phage tail protein [Lysinibacillus]MBE5082986.1 phage tail protein [Bacillus thuringiensis]ACA41225.1 Probable tail fiber protein (GpH) [Lysinibacillus sphaericus C3-41]AMO32861.1 hypothetical protein AR327_10630 [Lysinibacillus sphaericus]AMR92035.1 hypothetical protein A1T07_18575 [Lysinibacillus sphaericus]ANA46083.1 hypothetical protein A2J09_11245 [Lysinibacillus sphaericus]
MSEKFDTILTNAGLAAVANATITQKQVNFAKLGVGDSNGAYYTPTKEATALRNQKWIGNASSVTTDPDNPNWIVVKAVIPGTVGGFEIRELGIFDENNVLLAIGKLPQTYKPTFSEGSIKELTVKTVFEVTNTSAVTLKIDPSVIYASEKYVDDKVATVVSGLENLQQQLNQHITDPSNIKWIEKVEGTANTLTATHEAIPSYKNGLGVSFPVKLNSTAAMSLNINGLGAIPIKKANGTPFSNGIVNGVYTVRYRDGAFILQGESEVEIGKQIIIPGTTNKAILKGVHDGTGYVEGSPHLLASNIKKGVNIFGVVGTAPSEYDISIVTHNFTDWRDRQPTYTVTWNFPAGFKPVGWAAGLTWDQYVNTAASRKAAHGNGAANATSGSFTTYGSNRYIIMNIDTTYDSAAKVYVARYTIRGGPTDYLDMNDGNIYCQIYWTCVII